MLKKRFPYLWSKIFRVELRKRRRLEVDDVIPAIEKGEFESKHFARPKKESRDSKFLMLFQFQPLNELNFGDQTQRMESIVY